MRPDVDDDDDDYSDDDDDQARIQTSFHCFTEISQIFQNNLILIYPRKMELANILSE